MSRDWLTMRSQLTAILIGYCKSAGGDHDNTEAVRLRVRDCEKTTLMYLQRMAVDLTRHLNAQIEKPSGGVKS